MHWNYSDDNSHGPSQWSKYFPAAGDSQSPIDILVDECERPPRPATGACALSEQMQSRLNIGSKNHRTHLDSVGDDERDEHQRSPSTSSADSDASSNPQDSSRSSLASSHHHHHHQCKHSHQKTRYCLTNKKIFLGYPRYLNSIQLCNTGHAWQVNLPPELARHTLLTGPPLADREYCLAQFHCHWGEDCTSGSEHLINGRAFAAELHFVHWNCTDFTSMEEASKHKHGLAVLAVLLEAHDGTRNNNKHLDKILAGLPDIQQPDSSVSLAQARLDLKKLFPSNRCNYATYEGSLTTPPLSEVVDWIVFLQPVQCSSEQVAQFRRIKCPEGDLVKNCRPVQPINERLVSIWSHDHHCKQ